MAGSKKGDINKGRFSETNQPMKDESNAVKNAASRAMSETLLENEHKTARKNKHIKEDILEYIGDAILKEDKSGNSFIKSFIDDTLKTAKKDPKSPQAGKFLNILFREDLLDQLTELYNKKTEQDTDFSIYRIRQTLYDKQQEVYDNEIDKRILIINSRRSGKTELLGRLAAKGLLNPDGHVAYLNRNSRAAIRQIRKPLMIALEKTGLRIIKGSVENQELYMSNGSQILILGNNNSADVDKLRGERLSLVILDECGHQRNMRQIIREVIRPAMIDYGDKAQIVMVGTPPRIPHTYVEECWNNDAWRKYHWTFMDNPFVPNKETVISDVCEENGVTPESSFIQREYYGRMDAYDDDAKFIKKYTIVDELPKNKLWDYAWVGVDYGVTDKAAVVSTLCDSTERKLYVVRDWTAPGKEVSALCQEVLSQYKYLKENFNIRNSVDVITDTNNKEISLELRRTYKIPNVKLAYKHDRDMALDQLAEWFNYGRVSLLKGTEAVKTDADLMVWARDEETDKIIHELDDDTYHGNSMFALLYVSRQFDALVLGSSRSKTAKDIIESTRHLAYKGEYESNDRYAKDEEEWADAY